MFPLKWLLYSWCHLSPYFCRIETDFHPFSSWDGFIMILATHGSFCMRNQKEIQWEVFVLYSLWVLSIVLYIAVNILAAKVNIIETKDIFPISMSLHSFSHIQTWLNMIIRESQYWCVRSWLIQCSAGLMSVSDVWDLQMLHHTVW